MSDELLNYLSGQYIEHDIGARLGYTFAEYINIHNAEANKRRYPKFKGEM